jgi:hypothetical protein
MALPVLDAVFASSADLPRTQLLSKWLTEQLGSGSIADFSTLPERYLYAKIAVSLGGPRTEQEYIELPKSYAWSDIYGAIIFNRTAPAAPSSLTLTPLTSSSIKLDWVTNGASVAYSVERSVDGAAFQVIGTTAIGATTATNTGLSIASNYQYRIRGSSGGFFTGYSNTASASTYDANASSFIATSGATDIVAINDFVLGVKTLGLWNSMVCWPLRSSQNAGTGTTAFSLGGLGTYNGTLTNGPSWGADGVSFVAADSEYISTSFVPTNIDLSFGACWSPNDDTKQHTAISVAGVSSGTLSENILTYRGGSVAERGGSAVRSLNPRVAPMEFFTNRFVMASFPVSSAARFSVNGGTIAVGSGASRPNAPLTTQNVRIGRDHDSGAGNFLQGTVSVALAFNTTLEDSALISFYQLYKDTLGTGLGLP